jgi:hypothetical protein
MVYKKIPLRSQCSAFGHEFAELLLACLINLLPKSFGALLVSVWSLLQHFWGLIQDLEGGVFTSLSPAQSPWPLGGLPLPALPDCVDLGEGASLLASQGGEFWLHKGTWKGSGTNLGALLIRLVRSWVRIQTCLRRQKERLITWRHLSNSLLGCETVFQVQGVGQKYCTVWVWESVSLRLSLVKTRVQSTDPWVRGELIWSRVSPTRVSGLGFIRTHYG